MKMMRNKNFDSVKNVYTCLLEMFFFFFSKVIPKAKKNCISFVTEETVTCQENLCIF